MKKLILEKCDGYHKVIHLLRTRMIAGAGKRITRKTEVDVINLKVKHATFQSQPPEVS